MMKKMVLASFLLFSLIPSWAYTLGEVSDSCSKDRKKASRQTAEMLITSYQIGMGGFMGMDKAKGFAEALVDSCFDRHCDTEDSVELALAIGKCFGEFPKK